MEKLSTIEFNAGIIFTLLHSI